jgi:hypothetical protein
MIIYVSFKINQDTIAKTLCIKKEIKENTCQGKCQLKKALEKSDEEQQKQIPSFLKNKAEVLYCHNQNFFDFTAPILFYQSQLQSTYKSTFYISSEIQKIFRPPKLI